MFSASNREAGQSQALDALRHREHPRCFVCGQHLSPGLKIQYTTMPDDRVGAEFECPESWQGYGLLVHGGIIASLLDGAMTNWLFAHNIVGVTADLHIRYRHPLRIGVTGRVIAHAERGIPPLFVLHAEVSQNDVVCATAIGKFTKPVEADKG